MNTPLNVLIVEDSPEDAALIVHALSSDGFDLKWHRVDTEADFLAELDKGPDIVLSDYSMPRFDGLRAVDLLRARGQDIPFILISGTVGEETAVLAIKRGVTDYLLKDRIARLGSAVRRALQEIKESAQRRKLEEQFVEAQKMEVIGQLAGGVAHDFNNILAVVMGYSELMMQEIGPDNPLRDIAEEIRHASERAAALTRQLLVFSRKQTVQFVVIDINEVIHDMDKMLRRLIDANIEMTVTTGNEIGHIKADCGYIGQVLMNLVVNARDAMPNGGKLTITTSDVTLDESRASVRPGVPPGDYVLLRISDTGSGMTSEVKDHLFEAFFTTKPKGKGTGLGLATCQTIVNQSGGHIIVSSELGKGTTFEIFFPRVEQPQEVQCIEAPIRPVPRGTETLLLVEDEPTLRHLAQRTLEAQGYTVLPAANGQDALHAARRHKGSRIRLVVADVIMPLMGGKAMAESLKSANPDLKFLFTSGYTDDALTDDGTLEQGTQFLPKPYTPATLARKIRDMLDDKPDTTMLRRRTASATRSGKPLPK